MTRDEEAAKDPSLFDRRIVERNIRRGVITRKDYNNFLKSLGDATDKVAPADHLPADVEDDVEDDIEDDEADEVTPEPNSAG